MKIGLRLERTALCIRFRREGRERRELEGTRETSDAETYGGKVRKRRTGNNGRDKGRQLKGDEMRERQRRKGICKDKCG